MNMLHVVRQWGFGLACGGLLWLGAGGLASAGELQFGHLPVGSSKILRLYGGLGLSLSSSNGGSCAAGTVTNHVIISGANANEFHDLGGTYIGTHRPGEHYYEDIRFTPLSPGSKTALFTPQSIPVSPTCGLSTQPSTLLGEATPHLGKRHRLGVLSWRQRPPHRVKLGAVPLIVRTAPPPSLRVIATLSRNIYSGNAATDGYQFLSNTCTVLHYHCNSVEASANAYRSDDGSQIVITLRGSAADQTSLRDGLYALTTPSDPLNAKLEKAFLQDFAELRDFANTITSTHPHAHITLAGHSLGGTFAQFLSLLTGDSAYAFDAPGSQALFLRLAPQITQSVATPPPGYRNDNIRLQGDAVSAAGQLLGQTVTVAAPPELVSNPILPANVCTTQLGQLQQLHAMDTLLKQIQMNAAIVTNEPSGPLLPILTTNLWCEDPGSLF